MGYTKRPGTSITDYWPDDSDTEIYIEADWGYTLMDIMDILAKKWPNAVLSDIRIKAEKIHTHCLYYDLYDGSDYTNFIILEKID